jgi:2'-5' RNA ligase
MRAFFCIPISESVREAIYATAESLRSQTHMRANWVPKANYHVTLHFLGDIDPELTVDLNELCRQLCRGMAAFDCLIDRIGAFPSVERARVLWMGGDAPQQFQDLAQRLSAGLVKLGFPRERREKVVHITLARIVDHPDPALPEILPQMPPIDPATVSVDRVVLMESTLTRSGAVYTPLFTCRLGGPAA